MKNFFGMTLEETREYMRSIGETPAKGVFLFKKIYGHDLDATRENISPALMEKVKTDLDMYIPETVCTSESSDACKYLFKLRDGNTVESVVMKYSFGTGICVSTQVGCNMGCVFCQSGKLKKVRDLTPEEIVGQVVAVRSATGEWPKNIVVMGIGEPLDNMENVIRFIEIITEPFGAGYGSKHITVSTCGVADKIKTFTERVNVNLAVSLHAPYDELRDRLMPVNKAWPLEQLMGELQKVRDARPSNAARITFEYLLIDGVNDSDECARMLADLIKPVNGYVNLIPYNEPASDGDASGGDASGGDGSGFRKSPEERKNRFFDILMQRGCMTTVRREFGAGMNAACGQLKASYGKYAGK